MSTKYNPKAYTIAENVRIPLIPKDTSTEVIAHIIFVQSGHTDDSNACLMTYTDDRGETISTTLSAMASAYNLRTPEPNTFWVKDWFGNEGRAEVLNSLDNFEIVRRTGPLDDLGVTATLIRIVNFNFSV